MATDGCCRCLRAASRLTRFHVICDVIADVIEVVERRAVTLWSFGTSRRTCCFHIAGLNSVAEYANSHVNSNLSVFYRHLIPIAANEVNVATTLFVPIHLLFIHIYEVTVTDNFTLQIHYLFH